MHEQVFNLIKNLHRVDEIGSAYTKVPNKKKGGLYYVLNLFDGMVYMPSLKLGASVRKGSNPLIGI